jgi:hypothetical protein
MNLAVRYYWEIDASPGQQMGGAPRREPLDKTRPDRTSTTLKD